MNFFSISQLQQFSGIKAHTIRMWEQRYNALQPDRSEGNTRYYNGNQLRRLLNIVSLLDDYKVSELCSMTDKRLSGLLEEKTAKITSLELDSEYLVSQVIAAALEYNEEYFDKIFSNSLLRFGIKDIYTKVVYPSLLRLGLLWAQDALPPAQEHFITCLFRQKFLTATDSFPPSSSKKNTWLLFLPEDEFHEMGLLFANLLLKQAGKKVIYLGANVPLSSVKKAVDDTKALSLLFFLVRRNDIENDQKIISTLGSQFHDRKIYVACDELRLEGIKRQKNIGVLHTVNDLEELLKSNV